MKKKKPINALSEKRGIALNFKSYVHYTEHLAAVCVMMDIPLLTTDLGQYDFVKKYYPLLKVDFHLCERINIEYIYQNYDVLFSSDYFPPDQIRQVFGRLEKQHGKIMRHVFCSHGCSDKAFWFVHCAYEDICLIYGKQTLDMLEECQVLDKLTNYVVTGNYRYTYYQQHQEFFDTMVNQEVLSSFPKKNKTILYAPTLQDQISSTSFYSAFPDIIKNLPDEYNLIVKFHPLMKLKEDPEQIEAFMLAKKKENIILLWNYPLVFPLLNAVDIYLGDSSSIGYDFLLFRKPMFFLNQLKNSPEKISILNCGKIISPKDYAKTFQIIEKSLKTDCEKFDGMRQQICEYAFGKPRTFSEIKQDVINAYNSEETK